MSAEPIPASLPATEWLVDPTVAYLNHGGFGALPRPVADAAATIRAEIEANPTDVFMRRWPDLVAPIRQEVAAFLRADAGGLAFVPNATAGTATVLTALVDALPLRPGDEVVATDHRYPAVASQLSVLAARGVRVLEQHVPLDVPNGQAVVDAVLAGVGDRTRLVVIDAVASPTGFAFPVDEIVAAAHGAGIPVLVDAAHAPGLVDVDVTGSGADFWVGNLHKWVCSPRACAALVVAEQWRDRIRPLVASHGYAEGYAHAFDWTGTFDALPLLAIPAALEFWAGLGWDAVRRRQHELASEGARYVADALRTEVPIADEFTAAMRLIRLPVSLPTQAARERLAFRLTTEHAVTAHVTEHAGTTYVRVCGQLYNVPEHYERLAAALRAEL